MMYTRTTIAITSEDPDPLPDSVKMGILFLSFYETPTKTGIATRTRLPRENQLPPLLRKESLAESVAIPVTDTI